VTERAAPHGGYPLAYNFGLAPRWVTGNDARFDARIREVATSGCMRPATAQAGPGSLHCFRGGRAHSGKLRMLYKFITAHREEIIARTRAKVAKRLAPKPTKDPRAHLRS
jgi:hypothetical protein